MGSEHAGPCEKVFACRTCQGIVADGEPGLCEVRLANIVRRVRFTHARRHPARFDGVGVDIWPKNGDGEGQYHILKLTFPVCLHGLPLSLRPQQIVQVGRNASADAGTQEDEAVRPLNERCQYVWRQYIGGEDVRYAIVGIRTWFSIADANTVNHSVEMAQPIHLLRDGSHL